MTTFLSYVPARVIRNNKPLCNQINEAADRLSKKLTTFDFNTIDISDYNRNYLTHDHLSNITRTLQKYAYILTNAVMATKRPLSDITFLEYGGGIGMLSLLARQAGIGTVLYNDIYDVSCADAQTIASALHIKADHYILGDIDDVISYIQHHNLRCHAVASYDVIEHVYDINYFLDQLSSLSSEHNFTIFMSSGANTYNPRIKKSLQKHHHDHEYIDRVHQCGHKQRDCLQSFFTVRSQMIQEYAPTLSPNEVTMLAKATKGKIKKDIYLIVDTYRATNIIPAFPTETDTCDPYTGNWSKHLMDPYELKNRLASHNFDSHVLSGYYGYQNNRFKNYIGKSLNFTITYSPTQLGLMIAPFYTLFGTRTSGKNKNTDQ